MLPTSVADLDGYAPTRAAHDARCEPEPELPDFGDGRFARVFQPAMALVSVRRDGGRRSAPAGAPWPLERPDLAPAERALLARLAALPTLPAALFGERGVQTTRATRATLTPLADAGPGARARSWRAPTSARSAATRRGSRSTPRTCGAGASPASTC